METFVEKVEEKSVLDKSLQEAFDQEFRSHRLKKKKEP